MKRIMKLSDDCLKAFLEEGFRQSEIARACDISRQAVNCRLTRKKKCPKRLKQVPIIVILLNKGFTFKEICSMLHVCYPFNAIIKKYTTCRKHLFKKKWKWSLNSRYYERIKVYSKE